MRVFRPVPVLLALVLLVPTAAEAQQRPFVLSPEYAASVQTVGGEPRLGAAVRTFSARLNIRAHEQVSPWVSAGMVVRGGGCIGNFCEDSWLIVPGVRIDALRRPHHGGIRPYMVAGAGMYMDAGQSPHLLPSVGAGVRGSDRSVVAPRLEARWERYDGENFVMLSIGLGVIFGSSVTAIER